MQAFQAGQAISYLTHLAIPDSLDISQMSDLTFSAQTNGHKIQFFAFKKTGPDQCKNFYTSEFSLFEAESKVGIPSQ